MPIRLWCLLFRMALRDRADVREAAPRTSWLTRSCASATPCCAERLRRPLASSPTHDPDNTRRPRLRHALGRSRSSGPRWPQRAAAPYGSSYGAADRHSPSPRRAESSISRGPPLQRSLSSRLIQPRYSTSAMLGSCPGCTAVACYSGYLLCCPGAVAPGAFGALRERIATVGPRPRGSSLRSPRRSQSAEPRSACRSASLRARLQRRSGDRPPLALAAYRRESPRC